MPDTSKDWLAASLVMTFALAVGGLFVYGSWWRTARLPGVYRSELDRAQAAYDQTIVTAEPDPEELFDRGSRVDLLMKRLAAHDASLELLWQRSEFLRQHAHRLQRAMESNPQWSEDPAVLQRVRPKYESYRQQSYELATKVQDSRSPLQHQASLRLIREAITGGSVSPQQSAQYRRRLASLWSDERIAAAIRRDAAILSAWFWTEAAWQDAPRERPLEASDRGLADSL